MITTDGMYWVNVDEMCSFTWDTEAIYQNKFEASL